MAGFPPRPAFFPRPRWNLLPPPRPTLQGPLHRAPHGCPGGPLRTVASEGRRAQGKTFGVDAQRQDPLLAVAPRIARGADRPPRILLGLALHRAAGQVIEQDVELDPHRSPSRAFRGGSPFLGCGSRRSRQRSQRGAWIVPARKPRNSSRALAGSQRACIPRSLQGAHQRLLAHRAATRDQGPSAASSSPRLSQNRSRPRRLHNSRPR